MNNNDLSELIIELYEKIQSDYYNRSKYNDTLNIKVENTEEGIVFIFKIGYSEFTAVNKDLDVGFKELAIKLCKKYQELITEKKTTIDSMEKQHKEKIKVLKDQLKKLEDVKNIKDIDKIKQILNFE